MQKKRKDLNENPVGANCVRPHFEENTLKNQKGITLIALIITIIVMLILVGVTINVALNGGLFTKAEDAANLTTVEEEKEALSMAAIAAWDVKDGVNWGTMLLPDGFTGSDGTYTSSKSGKTYIVDKATAKVTEGGSEVVDNDLAYLKAELEGKALEEIFDMTTGEFKNSNIVFKSGFIIEYKEKEYIMKYDYPGYITDIYYNVIADNDYFNIVIYSKGAIISGLTENGKLDVATTKKLIIPKEIKGKDGKNYNVTEITGFEDNTDIEELEFESGIKLEKIGQFAFARCSKLGGKIVIPDGVISIGQYSFNRCISVESLTLPSTVEALSWEVFGDWTSEQTIYMKGRKEAPATIDDYQGYGWQHEWQEGCNANIVWDN